MSKRLNIVFMGTPDFAVSALDRLSQEHNIVCVYSQPPRPQGRGYELISTPVALYALEHGIPLRTPVSLKAEEEQRQFVDLKADVAVVAAYGLILPAGILSAFPMGCINIHGSLLPRWRGAAPIQRAIMAGDIETGVTIMQMSAGMDTGDMLLKKGTFIGSKTSEELFKELADMGAEAICEFLHNPAKYPPTPQDDRFATLAPKIKKEELLLDFSHTAKELERRVRAIPSYFVYKGERIRVLEAYSSDDVTEQEIGTFVTQEEVACGNGTVLRFVKLQRAGRKPLPIGEFIKGFHFDKDTSLCATR